VNELLTRELADAGYAGVEIRNAPMRTEVIIRASNPQDVLGDKGRRIRELAAVIQSRFGFPEGALELYAERVANRGLSAQAQAESLKYKLMGGLAVRRAAYGIVKFVMESGGKGVEVVVAGKLRGQRAKAMKFREGFMVKTGNSAYEYIDYATRHMMMRQGIMGCRVKIMHPHDPRGLEGVKSRLADFVDIKPAKEDVAPKAEAPRRWARTTRRTSCSSATSSA
jgi:ribosomal protein uS3